MLQAVIDFLIKLLTAIAAQLSQAQPKAEDPDVLPPPGTSPVPLAQLKDNALKYKRCTLDPNDLAKLRQACDRISKIERDTKLYSNLEAKVGVEKWAIAGVHYRESDLDMLGCLHNGDRVVGPEAMRLGLKTTHVPAGLGPWPDFESSAVDAIKRELRLQGWKNPPIGIADTIAFTERYNGLGPRNHGINSGYVWGGTSEEDVGGYSMDGVWDPNRVETRVGVVAIMKEMIRRELSESPLPKDTPDVTTLPSAQLYEKLRALARSSDLELAPIEELIAFHGKNSPKASMRYWAVVDFTQHSSLKRFYLLDVTGMTVEKHLVAHGAGSDPNGSGFARQFSNTSGSHMSSLGIVRCAELYESHGETRMRLDGLEDSNRSTRARLIVMHSAAYVSETTGQCGLSWGCLAVDPRYLSHLVTSLKEGSLLNVWRA